MKAMRLPLRYLTLSTLACLVLFPSRLESASLSGFKPGFNIRNLVKYTDLIVYGTVTNKEFVFRNNASHHQYTTDITVSVGQTIKGTPNAGQNLVKFMVEGGEGIHPQSRQDLIVKPSHTPDFEVGEQVLMFLSKSKNNRLNLPHGGYYVFYGQLGKMDVIDRKVSIPYTFKKAIVDNHNGQLVNKEIDIREHIDLPIDLVIEIGKASLIDYDAIVPLETQIRSVISNSRGAEPVIPTTLIDSLTQSANQIIVDSKNK